MRAILESIYHLLSFVTEEGPIMLGAKLPDSLKSSLENLYQELSKYLDDAAE